MHHIKIMLAGCLSACSLAASALQISQLSPQGEVAQVRQITVQFDGSAAPLGQPQAGAPVTVRCNDAQASQGSGRWTTDRVWTFDFANDLPPGIACTIQAQTGFKSPQGEVLPASKVYKFSTAGPTVQSISPYPDSRIEEDQFFTLQLNAALPLASLQKNVWCAVEGLGERVAVKLIDEPQRTELLKSQYLLKEVKKNPLAVITLACNRRLSANAKVQIVFGTGGAKGAEQRFNFQVREPFKASMQCERANAQSDCLPLRPISLLFTAPVAIKELKKIRLVSEKRKFYPLINESSEGAAGLLDSISFATPLPEETRFSLEIPPNLQDAAGRPLHNADSFPLKTATGTMPPLAKFAAAPFGIVERFAEPHGMALLPVTLRHTEAAPQGNVSTFQPRSDAEIISWFKKVQQYDAFAIARRTAEKDLGKYVPKALDAKDKDAVQTRMLSLLAHQTQTKTRELPAPEQQKSRPFEVVGIPLPLGFHVLEIASYNLGSSLLDARHGSQRTVYVRTSALVTNLAVHFKLGRENALAWVTSLDKGLPVAGAQVRVSDCRGKQVASGTSNAQGIAHLPGIPPEAPTCSGENLFVNAYFVSARALQAASNDTGNDAGKVEDMAFTWSDWNRGIEPWRFNLPTQRSAQADEVAHTIFDRTLFKAGETVSMKHLLRTLTGSGFALSKKEPATLSITHIGSGQKYTQSLRWRKTPTGGVSAISSFAIPNTAKLGLYQVELLGEQADSKSYPTGQFRVEEFRLPILEGRIRPSDPQTLISKEKIPLDLQVNYVAGGGAAQLPVRVSALVRSKYLSFDAFSEFSFSPPQTDRQNSHDDGEEDSNDSQDSRIILDKAALTLDKTGAGKITLDQVPSSLQPQELLLEATYSDPNGELQTLRSSHTLWPAAVVAGIKTEGWVSNHGKIKFQALALDVSGKPQAGVALQVNAVARSTTSTRKRMVGGFYTYDNQVHLQSLGTVCSGSSDARGLLLCETELKEAGEVELIVTAKDAHGKRIQAAASVYITRQGELWFGGDNHDRIDLLPEKKTYQPGEVAKFQVRMPFRYATALLTVEREGIVHSEIVQLNGKDPSVELKIQAAWGPNVYVSVLALRGRLREVPWYSFFNWGYKAPREWWTRFWYEGREYLAPTTLVDLSKPAFRLGVAEIQVDSHAHQLDVSVSADKVNYPVRGKAQVTIQVKLPNGKPAANAEVALAAVDQSLLELMPNTSWQLLEAMLQRRAWGVETSTAQMEIIGRRHYGRKAVAPGGGGGGSGTRELLNTLLLWKPTIQLDAQGQARVSIPLNDSLTRFKIVVVADAATGLFGTGSTSIRSTQDLQIISGLPPLVREDDIYRAQITLRNTTQQAMKVRVTPRATLLQLPEQTIDIPAQDAREVAWTVTAPAALAFTRTEAILWEIAAQDTLSAAKDAVKAQQRIIPAIAPTVQQATLLQLDGARTLEVSAPAGALPGRGGLKLVWQAQLAKGMPGVEDWFHNYPFACLEQKVSKAIALRDKQQWQSIAAQMPGYLDTDGLASYFPARNGEASQGSDTLTAYLLATAHEAATIDPAFAFSNETRATMERGLIDFVEGRIQREFWSPRKDLDVRKLAAIEALSRYGKAQGRMLNSLTLTPNQWPTHAVLDWLNILKRVNDIAERDKRMAEAQQILRARISYQGSKMVFSTEKEDYWWWLMQNGDLNSARLILSVLNDPTWKDDMGRLSSGLLSRQQKGAWQTTTANVWGGMALEKFSNQFESAPLTGNTLVSTRAGTTRIDWSKKQPKHAAFVPWSPSAMQDSIQLDHQGSGRPWLSLQVLAAVPLKAPQFAGYQIKKTITPVDISPNSRPAGHYLRGDVLRINIEVNASADMAWAVITDPIPAGASILGSKLGRDSDIATQSEQAGAVGATYTEQSFDSYRSYYAYLPKGVVKMQYTIRLNNAGEFSLPPSRVEAMYAPEMFGETPNAKIRVQAAP